MKGKNYKEDTTPEDVSDDQRTGGVFNMGIATLERINDVLKDIRSISILPQKTGGDMLILKVRLIRQLYFTALPLIKKEHQEELDKTVFNLKVDKAYNEEKGVELFVYTKKKEDEIDKAMLSIQKCLQESGNYFMPSSKDPKTAWSIA